MRQQQQHVHIVRLKTTSSRTRAPSGKILFQMDFQQTLKRISKNCEVTYQRIVELTPEDKESKDEMSQSTAVFRHKLHGPRREDVTDDQLKLCFHRITLTQDFSRLKDMAYEFPCKAGGCNTIFRGVYARTNLARHMGRKHNGPRVYFCEDKWCYRVFNRVFRRQDARLEHYRKYHLGVPRPYVARIEGTAGMSPEMKAQLAWRSSNFHRLVRLR